LISVGDADIHPAIRGAALQQVGIAVDHTDRPNFDGRGGWDVRIIER
jgi:hypothetical protein